MLESGKSKTLVQARPDLLSTLIRRSRDYQNNLTDAFALMTSEIYAGRETWSNQRPVMARCQTRILEKSTEIAKMMETLVDKVEGMEKLILSLPIPPNPSVVSKEHPFSNFSHKRIINALDRFQLMQEGNMDIELDEEMIEVILADLKAKELKMKAKAKWKAASEMKKAFGEVSFLEEKDGAKRMAYTMYHNLVMANLAKDGTFGPKYHAYEFSQYRSLQAEIRAQAGGSALLSQLEEFLKKNYASYLNFFSTDKKKKSAFGDGDIAADISQHFANVRQLFKAQFGRSSLLPGRENKKK